MARFVFKLPDVGEGIAEAEIAAWHVKVGDRVEEDDNLVDVMTDKATVELPSPVSGTVIEINGKAGDMMPVGSALVVLETDEDAAKAAMAQQKAAPDPEPEPEPATAPEPDPEPAAPAPKPQPAAGGAAQQRPAPGARPAASPAVRRRAREMGIDLRHVRGTGPGGRITHDDLDHHVAGGATPRRPSQAAPDEVEEIPVIGLRRRIAERMQTSKQRIPHFAYVEEVDVTALEELRAHLNATKGEERPRLTILPFLILALARTLPDFPQINARFDDEAGVIRRHRALHVGIATQTDNGLMVPVIRHAEALDLWAAAEAVARVADNARAGRASREELTGSTITITSLGPLGGIVSTPVINHPEVAIIGVNRIVERPMIRDGQVVARKMMNLSSSFDHRVVDGWDAARFIQRIKTLLENPATIFMDP